ncbi:hypothetical protein G6F41_007417 [Rhizopus arrhizus]|nr:hypothetical protein G6F41_007417 [Rhizopus arrhizus]
MSNIESAPWHEPTKIQRIKDNLFASRKQRRLQRQETAARFLQPPSDIQGFQYIYVPTKARVPIGQVRSHLRKLDINNNRILDIHYPNRNILALLVHNDYAAELRQQLQRFKIAIKGDFDPCSPQNLRYPKYANLPLEERTNRAFMHHCDRMERALQFIRILVKFAVARHFFSKGWFHTITIATLPRDHQTATTYIEQFNRQLCQAIYHSLGTSCGRRLQPVEPLKDFWTEDMQKAYEYRERCYRKWRKAQGLNKLKYWLKHQETRAALQCLIQKRRKENWEHFCQQLASSQYTKAIAKISRIRKRRTISPTFSTMEGPKHSADTMARQLENNDIQLYSSPIDIAQGGFRECRGSLDQALCLAEICQILHIHHKVKPTLIFLDIKSAYDTVDRNLIWQSLQPTTPPPLLALLQHLFDQRSFSYLEVPFKPGGYLNPQELIEHNVCKAFVMMNVLTSVGVKPNGFDRLLSTRFYAQIVRARLEYGLAINQLTASQIKLLKDAQNECLRRIYGAFKRASTKVMRHLPRLPTMKERLNTLQAQFLFRSFTLPEDAL